ncbi:unnamed protein product [Rhizoctonia solani]|uniref:Uncharacterized protein n=1 Tax=Rhizoctonia solani TaxID=456999 RepID=A0A8H3AWL5_9AGAM|nr:unnamed protein product [Rhizoctonia solani]
MGKMRFYQPRSSNKGTSSKHWYHANFGFPIEVFAIQPEIDLLVLVEGILVRAEDILDDFLGTFRISHMTYRLHFRTMSTNDPHWLARLPTLDTGLATQSGLGSSEVIISLNGRMVMLQPNATHPKSRNTPVVWDWVEGIEKFRLSVPLHRHSLLTTYSSYLLSEDYLAVSFPAESRLPSSAKLGHLAIYHLSSKGGTVDCVASFDLPSLFNQYATNASWAIEIGFGPAKLPWTSYWSTRSKYDPRIYDISPQNRSFYLKIDLSIDPPFNPLLPGSVGILHSLLGVPVQLIFSYLENRLDNKLLIIPWHDWGANLSWINSGSGVIPRFNPTLGMRFIAEYFSHYPTLPGPGGREESTFDRLVILDFDPQRLKFARLTEGELAFQSNHSPHLENETTDQESTIPLNYGWQLVLETPVNPDLCHRKISLKTNLPELIWLIPLMADDEQNPP